MTISSKPSAWLRRHYKKIKSAALRFWRRYVRKRITPLRLAGTFFVVFAAVAVYNQIMGPTINPTAYAPLLEVIAKGESKGNYNAYFGSVHNSEVRFTEMTIAEVMQWQEDYVAQGSPSSAVGKYQIIRPTLAGLVRQLGIDVNTAFDEKTQDALAIALLERRGALQYVQKEISPENFAANLAKEWATLPKMTGQNPEQSYYAADGLNKAQITPRDIHTALAELAARASL